jgi:WhiB family redox-sensing transcriptional regulator
LGLVAGAVLGRNAAEYVEPSWMTDRPACAGTDPEVFFPRVGDHYNAALARRICARCPIMAECREQHLDEQYGIWGGTNGRQRQRLRARRPGRPGVLLPRC